jgi:Glycosyl transferase family 41
LQEIRQIPQSGTKGGQEEVVFPVIELPTLLPIEQMIQTGQSHCSYGGVVVQNGVTTNQVTFTVTVHTVFNIGRYYSRLFAMYSAVEIVSDDCG